MVGHFSGDRLFKLVSNKWWWDSITYCRNCPECAVVSGVGKASRPLVHPIPVGQFFQIWGVDIMELPTT